jgi:hypothetical protein
MLSSRILPWVGFVLAYTFLAVFTVCTGTHLSGW